MADNPAKKMLEELDKIDVENQVMEQSMFGVSGQLNIDPRVTQIASLLQQNPIVITPALKWVQQTIGRINLAQLKVLYGEEELERMLEEANKT